MTPGGVIVKTGPMARKSQRERRRKRPPTPPPDEESGAETVIEYETESSDDECMTDRDNCSCKRKSVCLESMRDCMVAFVVVWWALSSFAKSHGVLWYATL